MQFLFVIPEDPALSVANGKSAFVAALGYRSDTMLRSALVLAVAALPVFAQSTAPVRTAADVAARLDGQPLMLRGFWMADKMTFDAAGHPAGPYPTGPFTLSGFQEAEADVAGQTLTLKGERIGLIFGENGKVERIALHGSSHGEKPEEITLHIAADAAGNFVPALDAIFATTLREIAPTLPELWQGVARRLEGGEHPENTVKSETRQAAITHVGTTVKPPKLLKSADPVFPEAARRLNFSRSIEIYLWLETDGHPDHIRTVRPVGLGLDEAAADAVSRYVFSPATKDGQPVKVDMYVDVSIDIF